MADPVKGGTRLSDGRILTNDWRVLESDTTQLARVEQTWVGPPIPDEMWVKAFAIRPTPHRLSRPVREFLYDCLIGRALPYFVGCLILWYVLTDGGTSVPYTWQ